MLRIRFTTLIAAGIISVCALPSMAQLTPEANSLVTHEAEGKSTPLKYRASADGKLTYLGASFETAIPTGVSGSQPEQAVNSFIASHGAAFGLDGEASALHLKRSSEGNSSTHLHYTQQYHNVPVFGSGINIQVTSGGNIKSVISNSLTSTKVFDKGLVSLTPTLDQESAELFVEMALEESLELSGIEIEDGTELMIYSPQLLNQTGGEQLVWNIVAAHEYRNDIRMQVLLNAHTGEIALEYSLIHIARERKIYDSNNTDADPGTLILTEDSGSSAVADVNDAFNYLGDTYDYFFNNHNRDSLDDEGYVLEATVRICPPGFGCPMQNAFWNGARMYFGQGFSSADDVVGHELVHGLTDFTSDLIYYSQSGAINEALSDIFGEFIDQTNDGGDDSEGVKWKMGEDIPGFGAIRDMKDPTVFGDPDRRCSPLYYTGPADNQGVHWNSGLINKLAYLLVDGENFNGHDIVGMGIEPVSDLFFYCEVNLLSPSSDFTDLYDAITQAAIDLEFSEEDKTNIENACQAVEISRINPCFAFADNDTCGDALLVTEAITTFGSNESAASDPAQSCIVNDGKDVWYYIIPNLTGAYSINTFGSDFDTTLSVYNSCGGELLFCNDDTNGLQSEVYSYLDEGQIYLIRVAGYSSASGIINLTVQYDLDGNGLSFDLDSNPHWLMEGGWSFGPPSGQFGNPSSAYTGSNVLGYERDGYYPNSLTKQYITTRVLDLTNHEEVELEYMRYLGVDGYYDNASVQVTNDGSTWHTVWANATTTYDDNFWVKESIDISSIADEQETVQVRWVMGDTSSSGVNFGWNIDDIEFVTDEIEVIIIDSWVDFDYGGTSTGEEDFPFKHVMTAIQYAEEDGSSVIKIKGDSPQPDTTEIGMISKPLRIEAINGTVRLGDDSE